MFYRFRELIICKFDTNKITNKMRSKINKNNNNHHQK